MWRCSWMFLAVLAFVSGEYLMMGGHLDNNAGAKSQSGKIESSSTLGRKAHLDDLDLDLATEESIVSAVAAANAAANASLTDDNVPRYHIPYPFAFNGGRPFSLEKDPVTGKIDFEKAPPIRALNYTGRYREQENKKSENGSEETGGKEDTYLEQGETKDKHNDDVGPNEINTYTPNFHDFLNLPVHYSSDKYGNDKYPLISSSYANTKVQSGANSYSTYNHRPYHIESDLYAHYTRDPYVPIAKTSAHKTTIINDFKAKWTSATDRPSTITDPTPMRIATNPTPKTVLSTSPTAPPIITTWKPSANTSPLVHSIDRTIEEKGSGKGNVMPIEKLQASGQVEAHQKPNNVPTRSPNDGATVIAQAALRYKDQSNLNNFVLSHVGAETKSSAQNEEEYKDSYDIYESPDSAGESDGEVDSEDDGEGDDHDRDNDGDGNSEEEILLPVRDPSRKNIVTPAATASSATASTAAKTTSVIIATSAEITSGPTIRPSVTTSGSVSSALLAHQEDQVSASNPLQFPIVSQHPSIASSSSSSSDRRQSVTERHDGVTSHAYTIPVPTIHSEQDKTGPEIVIESTSNIVIPPDQDTVSFVLGNRQNVDGGYYSVGTAIGEDPYGSLSDIDTSFWSLGNNPHDLTKEVKYQHPPVSFAELNTDRLAQKWWPASSSALKSNNELEQARPQTPLADAFADAAAGDTKNRSKETDNPNYVTFPNVETKDKGAITEEEEEEEEEHIAIMNESDGNIRELPLKAATLTTNNTKINPSTANASGDLPQLAENLVPPAEISRPPSYYYHYQYDTLRADHPRPQRLPPPPRVKPHSGPPVDIGLRRRPYLPDAKLPNILPQFRPNAKASHGHRFGSDMIGTMPAGQSLSVRVRQPSSQNHPSSRRPPPPSPLYLQRLNPPPPPIRAVKVALASTPKVDSVALPHETEPTIRRLRLPHVPSASRLGGSEENALSANRLLGHGVSRNEGGSGGENDDESKKQNRSKSEVVSSVERENGNYPERYPEEPPMTPPRPPIFPRRRTADPPRVTTLQMIQHHGEFGELEAQFAQPMEPVLAHQVSAERRNSDNYPSDDSSGAAEQPVYVVYPVNTAVNIHPDDSKEKDGSVVVGTRGPHRPLPPDTLLQDERDRQKVHTVYNGRPVASDFPYPLERPESSLMFSATGIKETPLLVPSEQRQQTSFVAANEQDSVNVIPYLQDFSPYQRKNDAAISVTLHRTATTSTSTRSTSTTASTSASPTSASASTPASTSTSTSTSTPIAYVYTPTRAAAAHRPDDDASIDATAPVLLPSQQPSSSSSSAPAPQNFMAPFVASMSAEAPTKNGWSVVIVEPPPGADKRLDDGGDDARLVSSEVDTGQTERNEFDADNFKPQLFGGFKPIYEFPTEDTERRENVAETNAEINMPRDAPRN